MASIPENRLSFIPFSSSISPSFWNKFNELKLDVYQNSDEKISIFGCFSCRNTIPSRLVFEVDSTSFNRDYSCTLGYIPYYGAFFNENTIENFKVKDKNALLSSNGKILLDNIKNGTVLKDPSLLNTFVLLSYADLKKYQYYYWFAFISPNNLELPVYKISKIVDVYSEEQLDEIYKEYVQKSFKQRSFFAIKKGDTKIVQFKELFNSVIQDIGRNFLFCFSDGSDLVENPGWVLKNFILFIYETWPDLRGSNLEFLGLRLTKDTSNIVITNSIIYNILLPEKIDTNSWVGWEKTEQGKLGPRMVNLKASIDPKSLIESSSDLNIKLMKWRMVKDIDLSKLTKSKCLLLGAGTLGCTVATSLMAWGIRYITFVDNSNVSYSNPSRQILYNFEDCVKNSPKALAAAENLRKVLPHIKSKGIQLTIPMPGHVVSESFMEQTKYSVNKLEELIKEHDVIFLLTDSRESRWLPAVIGLINEKIVINAALGFDTYLVMRHGASKMADEASDAPLISNNSGFSTISGQNLGCYFCTDVTAPGNSQANRTLDQQCTVTRPGVAMIAGALATELMISILLHKVGNLAPAFYKTSNKDDAKEQFFTEPRDECMLGIIPHSIRGFLSSFTQVLPATHKFNKCICCSDQVLNEYKSHGFDFVLEVLNNSKYLEDLTGITEMNMNAIESQIEELDLSDED